jgi:hypothetical protein
MRNLHKSQSNEHLEKALGNSGTPGDRGSPNKMRSRPSVRATSLEYEES